MSQVSMDRVGGRKAQSSLVWCEQVREKKPPNQPIKDEEAARQARTKKEKPGEVSY